LNNFSISLQGFPLWNYRPRLSRILQMTLHSICLLSIISYPIGFNIYLLRLISHSYCHTSDIHRLGKRYFSYVSLSFVDTRTFKVNHVEGYNHLYFVYCTVLYCTVLYCTVLYCTVTMHWATIFHTLFQLHTEFWNMGFLWTKTNVIKRRLVYILMAKCNRRSLTFVPVNKRLVLWLKLHSISFINSPFVSNRWHTHFICLQLSIDAINDFFEISHTNV
jgi:hypothetical protein